MDRPARDWTGAEPGRHRAYYSANATPSGRPAQTLAISIQLWHPQRNRRDAKSVARQNHNQSCRRAGCRLQVESCRLASNALGQLATCNLQLATSSQPANNFDYCSTARQSRNRNRGIREIRGRRDTSRAAFRVFRVFCGSSRWGNCSQAANNLDYCSAEKKAREIALYAITCQ